MEASIRPGRDADGPGFLALIGACWAEYEEVVDVLAEIPEIHALASALTSRGGALWAAEMAGRIVGMVAAYPAAEGWHLSRMYVQAAQRGTGLASALLHRAEAHARTAGARHMVLWSDVRFTRAHAFYSKHGYLRHGSPRPLEGFPDVIEAGFAKRITPEPT